MKAAFLGAAMLAASASLALAQNQASPPSAAPGVVMDMPMKAASSAAADAPSTQAYRQAMQKMHAGMDITYTGDSDHDFVAGMIAHHQGAIDMARVELRYGKDRTLKKLARRIISAQEKEIRQMRAWQAKHPAPAK